MSAAAQSSSLLSVRPTLTRSRSSTSPASPSNLSIETSAADLPGSPPRPGAVRSRSYVSTLERRPPPTIPLPPIPAEKPLDASRFHRLHLPGKHAHGQGEEGKPSHHKKHRYTQSENQQYHRKNEQTTSQESPVRLSDQNLGIPPDLLYPGSRGTAIPSLMRMASFRSYRAQPQTEENSTQGQTRTRASSDPKSPTSGRTSAHVTSPIGAQLEKADLRRYVAHQDVTQSDLDRLDTQLKKARAELATRLESDNSRASSLMARLDQSHETLHRSAESLVDTLSSFSSLAQQSAKLLSNFETETSNLDSSIRQRILRHRKVIWKARTDRVIELEERGRAVGQKAEDLGQRLGNCRVIVQNWEEREKKKRKTWKGVRNGILCGMLIVILGILAGFLSWKAVQFSDGKDTAMGSLAVMLRNESWKESELVTANLPDDVRMVLQDIASRAGKGRTNGHLLEESTTTVDNARTTYSTNKKSEKKNEKRFRLLDEL